MPALATLRKTVRPRLRLSAALAKLCVALELLVIPAPLIVNARPGPVVIV